jgi:hypothetical protein
MLEGGSLPCVPLPTGSQAVPARLLASTQLSQLLRQQLRVRELLGEQSAVL